MWGREPAANPPATDTLLLALATVLLLLCWLASMWDWNSDIFCCNIYTHIKLMHSEIKYTSQAVAIATIAMVTWYVGLMLTVQLEFLAAVTY